MTTQFTFSRILRSTLLLLLPLFFLPSAAFAAQASGWVSIGDQMLGNDASCGATSAVYDFQTVAYSSETPVVPTSITVEIYTRATGVTANTVTVSGGSLTGTTCLNVDTQGMRFFVVGGANYYNFQAAYYWLENPPAAYGKRIRANIHLRPTTFATQDMAHVSPVGGASFLTEPSYQLALNSFTNTHNATGTYKVSLFVQDPSGTVTNYLLLTSGGTGAYTFPPRGFSAPGTYFWAFYIWLNGTSTSEIHTPGSAFSGWESFVINPTPTDLVTQNLALSGTLTVGSTLTFSGNVRNVGVGPAPSGSTARWCIDNPSCSSSASGQIATDATAALAQGASSPTFSHAWVATAGAHTIYFCADVGATVPESNEGNNCASSGFTVVQSPTVITNTPTAITGTTATLNGTANPNGAGGSGCADSGWDCTAIDTAADMAAQVSVAISPSGNPWVSYRDATSNSFKVARYVGSGGTGCASVAWTCTTVDTTSAIPSIAFDPSGNPWVSYVDNTNWDLRVARYVGSGGTGCASSAWTCTSVDAAGNVGSSNSIAIDSSGNPWVSYIDSTNTDLKVARYVGSGGTGCASVAWTCTAVDTAGFVGFETSIAIDSSGNPRVSYEDVTNKDLKVARYVGSGGTGCASVAWTCTAVDTAGNVGGYSAIAFDSSGNPWVSYYDYINNDLKITRYVGSGGTGCASSAWTCTSVDTAGVLANYTTSIDIDSSGNPWVSYYDNTNTGLKVARYVGSGGTGCASVAWTCTAVDTAGDVGIETSIALDSSGNPWVSYQDVTNLDLKIAKYGGTPGAATTGWFRYSATNPGSCNDTFGTRVPASGGTALGSGSVGVPYANAISGLTTGTTYYYCAIASNSAGTAFGAVLSFVAGAAAPAPILTVTPAQLDFGTVAPSSNTSLNFTVSNTGGAGSFLKGAVTLTDPRFTCTAGCDYSGAGIAAGASQTATIRFSPGASVGYMDDRATFTGTNTNADGVNWSVTRNISDALQSVTYGNGLFVAVAYNSSFYTSCTLVSRLCVITSPDGITWTARTAAGAAGSNWWQSVTYGNGLFVAVGQSGGIMTSPDGINWTLRTSPVANDWTSVTYGGGKFVAVSWNGTGNRVMTSPDGITWTARTSAADNQWSSVTYGGGLFAAVSNNGVNQIMTSPDGITWTSRSVAGTYQWLSVTYGNGLFVSVSVASYNNNVMTSPDGITWTLRTNKSIYGPTQWSGITYGNGLFVAVSEFIMTSPDGITWTARRLPSAHFSDVAFGNGNFVAVDDGGTIVTSTGSMAVLPIAGSVQQAPAVVTSAATGVSGTGATLNGTANPNGLGGSGCAAGDWTCSTIDTALMTGEANSLAFDATGNPWVSYIDYSSTIVHVARYVGSGGTGCLGSTAWTCMALDATIANAVTSIIVDNTGVAWVAYQGYNSDLNIARYVGSGGTGCSSTTAWTCTMVDAPNYNGISASIALSPSGVPWVSYYEASPNFDLHVARYVGSGGTGCSSSTAWTCVVVDAVGGDYTGIAFDGSGNAWVSYQDTTNLDLKVARYVGSGGTGCSSSAWTCTSIETTGSVGRFTSIAVDASGNPWVSYWDYTPNYDVKVARYVGSGGTGCSGTTAWTCTIVYDGNVMDNVRASIAIDPLGNPWVSYRDSINYDLYIARYVGSGGTGCASSAWTCTVLEKWGGGSLGAWSSLKFDPSGQAWVSYTDGDLDYNLKIARHMASGGPSADTTGWFRYSSTNPGSCNNTFGTRVPASGGTAIGSGSIDVPYANAITGLTSGTTYYYCAIASNSAGTAFGTVLSFIAGAGPQPDLVIFANPTLNTGTLTAGNTVTLKGTIGNSGTVPTGGSGGWTTSYDTPKQRVKTMITDSANGAIYAGGDWFGFIYRCAISTGCDAAGDWITSYDTPAEYVYSFALDSTGGVLYAGAGGSGGSTIYRCATSTLCNAASDWTSYSVGGERSIQSLVVDFTNGVLYAGTGDNGIIYRCATSTLCDTASDWTTSYDTLASYILSLTLDSVNGVLYAGTGVNNGTIYRCVTSTLCDTAGDWTISHNDTTQYWIYSLTLDSVNGVLYAGTSLNGIIKRCATSTGCDAASDWTVSYDTPADSIVSFTLDSINGVLYAGGDAGGIIYRCATSAGCDAASDWVVASDTPEGGISSLTFDPVNSILYAGTSLNGIIYRCATLTGCIAGGFVNHFHIDVGNDGSVANDIDLAPDPALASLAAGAGAVVTSGSWANIPAGTHRIILCADQPPTPNGVIAEPNETNNCNAAGTGLITVASSALPDLVIFANPTLDTGTLVGGNSVTFKGTIGNAGGNLDVGMLSSISVGTDGFPVIAYHDATNLDLKLAKCGNASCSSVVTATLDSAGYVGYNPSLAIGTDGFPVISHFDFTNGDLKLTKCGNISCSSVVTSTLDSAGQVGLYSSITIGTDGFPVIAYYDVTNRDLKLAKCGNISCSSVVTSTLDSVDAGRDTSIAIGTDGFPVISYRNATNLDLMLAKCGNISCSSVVTSTLDSAGDVGYETSIAIGTDGFPVISYFDITNFDLKLAKCGNASCSSVVTSTLDSAGNVGWDTSLAIGTDGFPVISYRDSTNLDLKLAKCGNASCSSVVTSTLDSAGDVGNATSIAIGTDGFPVVSYYDGTNDDLKLAKCGNISCSSVVTSMLDGTGAGAPVSTSFTNRFEIDVNNDGSVNVTLTPHPSLASLAAGAGAVVTSGTWANIPAGTHRIILCADQPTPLITESSETNNCNDVGTGLFTVVPPPSPLAVTLAANPVSGQVSFSDTLTATVSGSASGLIDYYFWWDCAGYVGIDPVAAETACGNIPPNPPVALGACRGNTVGHFCSQIAAASQPVTNTYTTAGNLTPMVIVQRGGFWTQATTSLIATLPPALTIAPPNRDFGNTVVNTTKDGSFTITNSGGGTLTGTFSFPAGPFTCSTSNAGGCNFSLTGGQSTTIWVTFSPTTLGLTPTYSINVTSNVPAQTILVWGTGVPPVSGASLDFGRVPVLKSKDLTLTITNNGAAPLSGTLTVPAPFTCVASSAGMTGALCNYNLAVGGTNTMTMRFTPPAAGTFTGAASLSGDPTSTFGLTGVGYKPAIQFRER